MHSCCELMTEKFDSNLMLLLGNTLNEDGDIIISETEYLEIKKLKDLKNIYKTNFEELKVIKSEVQYCQRLVDQCRQRLIQGENFYVNALLNTVLVYERFADFVCIRILC